MSRTRESMISPVYFGHVTKFKTDILYRILDSHIRDSDEYCVLNCDAVQPGISQTFRRTVLPPSSRSKSKPSERAARYKQ
jgi:hypothetical protein